MGTFDGITRPRSRPWLGTEPSDVPEIDLRDETWRSIPWWERVLGSDWDATQNEHIDRAIGPEYRMWEEQR